MGFQAMTLSIFTNRIFADRDFSGDFNAGIP
jgi:hypothetical protein